MRLKLNSLQRKNLTKWSHTYRYTYNRTVWLNEYENYTKLQSRDLIVPQSVNSRTNWVLETPKSLRENAVFECVKNKKACFTNLRNGNILHFKQRFLSSKKESWTIGGFLDFKRTKIREIEFFPRFNFGRVRTTETVPEKFKTCTIHFDGLHYYINFVIEVQTERCVKPNLVCSIDPGVKTFHTIYNPCDTTVTKVGTDANSKLYKKLLRLDTFISKKSKGNSKQRKKLKDNIIKTRLKIQNMQKELHCKVADYLTKNYNEIIIPRFDSKSMSCKKERNIVTKTVRNMSSLAHGKFLERLKTKAIERSSMITEVDEKYTTMTCSTCFIRNSVGSLDSWICTQCSTNHDRDSNASKNIFLKTTNC